MTHVIDEDRVAHYLKMFRTRTPVDCVLVRKLPNGRHTVINGVQRIEASKREGYVFSYATIVECTNEQAEELWRETRTIAS